MWDTSPPRQVMAEDFVREFKMLCNPVSPVGAPGYFTSTIAGMKAYCAGSRSSRSRTSRASRSTSPATSSPACPTDPSTLIFKLLQPAADFMNILTMGFSSARPAEYEKYLPDSAQLREHTIADGPYEITSYTPTNGFTLERQPGVEGRAIRSATPTSTTSRSPRA